jgi:hypothetical protein
MLYIKVFLATPRVVDRLDLSMYPPLVVEEDAGMVAVNHPAIEA